MAQLADSVVVCADSRERLDQLSPLLNPLWQFERVVWPGSLPPAAAGYVVFGNDFTNRDALALVLAARASTVPLIVVGDLLRAANPTLWLPAPSDLIQLALERLIGTTIKPSRWRRKADMIIGTSSATRQLLHSLDQLAPAATAVAISGESGVGKELVAQALHYCSPRADNPFVAINCAAIPETLFESELFGYERGAFTGAVNTRDGALAAADRGTLFLDEIGEMPLGAQAKLLRVLETGEVQRIGSTERRRISFRLITATNRNLIREVEHGRFREDLYYRIQVVPLRVVPLRERGEDVPAIANHYLSRIADRERRSSLQLTAAAIDRLVGYSWPGNVRELVNVLERAVLAAGASRIDAHHLDLPERANPRARPSGSLVPYRDAKNSFEHEYYSRLMIAAGGNITLAARLGQKTRKEIYDALRRLNIDATEYRE